MTAHLSHFALNADDVDAGIAFCRAVFGWTFEAYGPPGFYRMEFPPSPGPVIAAIQQRRELVPGTRATGPECTIGVDDVDETVRLVEEAGGRIVMPTVALPGVGRLMFFADPSGNVLGAMQYDTR